MTPLQVPWIESCLQLDLRPTIGDVTALNAWTAQSARPFHLEVDTGMSRSGVRWDDHAAWDQIRTALKSAPGWEGAFTHFLAAESDPVITALQWDRFQQVLESLPRRPSLVHAANSAAALTGKRYAADLVRPGIFLYGGEAGTIRPRPVAALRARVVALRSIAAGDPVGYNAFWLADRRTTIATIGLGYADGLPRSPAREKGVEREIELRGRVAPIVGRVTMDLCMAAVTDEVALGDVATIYGGLVSLDRQAEDAGTVSYELLIRLGPRLPRCYRNPS
jgi:alanine racemase